MYMYYTYVLHADVVTHLTMKQKPNLEIRFKCYTFIILNCYSQLLNYQSNRQTNKFGFQIIATPAHTTYLVSI